MGATPYCGGHRQSVGEGASRKSSVATGSRGWPGASALRHCPHRRSVVDGQPNHRLYLRQCRRPGDPLRQPQHWPWLKHLFACVYDRTRLKEAPTYQDLLLEIIRRTDAEPGLKNTIQALVRRAHLWLDDPWKGLIRDYGQLRVEPSDEPVRHGQHSARRSA